MSQSKMDANQTEVEYYTQDTTPSFNPPIDHSPLLLAINRVHGTSIYTKKFDMSIKYNEELIGIGIHAFRIFLLDAFERKNISSIKIDDMYVKMLEVDDVIVYYIYKGEAEDKEDKFQLFIERLVNLDCWKRFHQSEYSVFKKDSSSITNVVEDIFVKGSIDPKVFNK